MKVTPVPWSFQYFFLFSFNFLTIVTVGHGLKLIDSERVCDVVSTNVLVLNEVL